MDHFNYRGDIYYAEDMSLETIANRFGTPCYVYSRATLERHYRAFDEAFDGMAHMICYSVKANSNLAVLNTLARLGAGFDIVSGGELQRVVAAGGDPQRVVFSGVGKLHSEIELALNLGIHCFNVESAAELTELNQIAGELGKIAPVSLRVNPDVDAQTHPYISTGLKENKFGIDINQALSVYLDAAALPNLKIVGLDCHIGSQLTQVTPFVDALDRVLVLIDALEHQGITLEHLDIGGGLGVRYRAEEPPHPKEYASALLEKLGQRSLTLICEPGRAIVANAGVLLTRVERLKLTDHKHFAVVDAAMNDLIRPALYGAWMDIVPVRPRDSDTPERLYDLVGPICETGDFLGKDRSLRLEKGDLLAIRSAGAYGFVMSSNYNTRPRAAEVIVDGEQAYLVRRRETVQELLALESLLP